MESFAALYDLSQRTSTYDYFTWQAIVQSMGATEIVFRTDHGWYTSKYPAAECRRRFENYILPGPSLQDLPVRIGNDGRVIGTHNYRDLFGKDFRRFKSVLPPRSERYTVTLRQTDRNAYRNSDVSLWRRFAAEIGAYVIEDHSVQPIDLYDRMALYAGAQMNFGVTNGPMALLYFTDYPMAMFDCQNSKSWELHGVEVGGQIPWLRENQRLIWKKPTMEMLLDYVKAL
jgi:hypothetical protein